MEPKKFMHRLFTYMVQKIMKSEKIYSEIEVQKIIVAPKEQIENELELDDDTYNQMNDMKDTEEREMSDPFSLDDVDIQTSNTGNEEEEFMD
jgi:hypothetical protein